MTDKAQIAEQARTISALWHRMERARKRIEVQQGMIVWLQARVSELEAQQTPEARIAALFKEAGE
ncbi:hypothetical protein [Profundibacterium mesophilum]|uniref:Uncharacterized protein n=1 Tax=Profundibacterium mesophilum KAUST100406-0324 TaxID=1037889 RepID=A0A921NTU8_9RHOB|nr:hypothetical protein [Profundibacterium mesophilum]KAF0675086.1 hypothetical protein PMES_02607 [Profundibacterium mesophilum KAUST100406-0324]